MELLKHRLKIALFVPLLFFFAFSGRLFYLQIHKGAEYKSLSEKNILRILELPAPRGRIFDRNGKKILYNKPSFNIQVFPKEITNAEKLAEKLSEITNVPKDSLLEKLRKIASSESFNPVTIAEDISRENLLLIEKNKEGLSGVFLELGHKRFYPYGEAAALLLGYSGIASGDEIKSDRRIKSGTRVGKMGAEKVFDSELRGTSGIKHLFVNAYGKTVSGSFSELPLDRQNKEMVPGKDISLSIDIDLQIIAEETLGDEKGAIVAMDVKTGEILAMASNPSYSPEDISKGISSDVWKEIEKGDSFSLLNRSTQGTYPPGSTLKIVSAFALLREKATKPNSSVHCPGYHTINGRRFNCWEKEGHGYMNLRDAIVESCDVYFYKLSQKLGVDKFHMYMKKFGFGEKTGVELPEKRGLNPSRTWKRKHLRKDWYPGETALLYIGQGYINVTPLQINVMTSAIANGGVLVRPTIRKIEGEIPQETNETVQSLEKEYVTFLKKALYEAVNGHKATGIPARSSQTSISGKTGTAQVASLQVQKESKQKQFRDHAWFTSYAPSDSPEISVTVLIENGGSGSSQAAPRAKKIIETYFKLRKKRDKI